MQRTKVKILGVSCAHRKGRNTSWLVLYALKAAEKFGRRVSEVADLETEFVDLADKKIRSCLNCDERHEIPNRALPYKGTEPPKPYGCIIKNDYLATTLWPKIAEADGFVFGSPVFTLSYSSKFRILFERLLHATWQGYTTNKPAGVVATGMARLGGQETCLDDMSRCIRGVEMLPVSFPLGAAGVSGPPNGPLPAHDDGKVIGQKKDWYGNYLAMLTGRRVAELAFKLKLANKHLGDLCTREFIHIYHIPWGEQTWAWTRLDKEDEEFLNSLEGGWEEEFVNRAAKV